MTQQRRRVVFVSTRPVWPPFPGANLRAHLQLRALVEDFDVDAIFLLPADEPAAVVPPDVGVRSCATIAVPRRAAPQALARWARSRWPWDATKLAYELVRGDLVAALAQREHELVWLIDSSGWPAMPGGRSDGALLVDFDDLEDYKIEHRRASEPRWPSGAKDLLFRMIDRIDMQRWRRLQNVVREAADGVLVCSDLDCSRLGFTDVHRVPNGYLLPQAIDGPAPQIDHRLLFAGNLTYRPNLEALQILIDRVMPVLRQEVPDAQLRVVGAVTPDVERWLRDPAVAFLGRVESIETELRGAICTAPLMSGGGTRIKIVEAFAHRAPVVATTVGAEGLDVVDGEHLIIRDDPVQFAHACVELMRSPDIVERLTHAAAALYDAEYTPAVVRTFVQAATRAALADG